MEFEMLEYGDTVELMNGDICVYIRREIESDGFMVIQELVLINIFTGEEHYINLYEDDLTRTEKPELSVKEFAN